MNTKSTVAKFTVDYLDNDAEDQRQIEIESPNNKYQISNALLAAFADMHVDNFDLVSFTPINAEQYHFAVKCAAGIAHGFDYVATGFVTKV
jgi:hypothetical protein